MHQHRKVQAPVTLVPYSRSLGATVDTRIAAARLGPESADVRLRVLAVRGFA